MKNLFHKPLPAHYLLFAFLGGIAFMLLFSKIYQYQSNLGNKPENFDEITSKRLESTGFEYIKPLLYIDRKEESKIFSSLKLKVEDQVDELKRAGMVTDVGVYVREFDRGDWMGIGEEISFHPGSLFKVPVMMAALRIAEKDSAFLNKKIPFFLPKDKVLPVQNYTTDSLIHGRTYTISDLLKYTIVHSDNRAYWLLSQHLDWDIVNKVHTDISKDLPKRGAEDGLARTNARSYSKLLIALYNATYLRPELSEYAMQILAECKFDQGLKKGMPSTVKLAHKFAEWDNGKIFELHESGIVYLKGKPYVITIMTQGAKRADLPSAIASIAKTLYDGLAP
jgi:beta-lactamase class A